MTGDKPDERIRAPMPWTGDAPGVGFTSGVPWEEPEPGYETANVKSEAATTGSLLDHYRQLIALRAAHPALRHGAWLPLRSSVDGVYAFLAAGSDETVAVILNLGDAPVRGVQLGLGDLTTCPRSNATVAYADGPAAPVLVAAPAFGADGSLDGWSPVPDLPARSTLLVSLH